MSEKKLITSITNIDKPQLLVNSNNEKDKLLLIGNREQNLWNLGDKNKDKIVMQKVVTSKKCPVHDDNVE